MIKLNNGYSYFQKQLKNRSSKDLMWLTGVGTKNIMRCVSGEQLNEWAKNNIRGASAEIARRAKKRAKKEARG